MGDMNDKFKKEMNDLDNKAHEYKGRIKQKAEDVKDDIEHKE